MISTLATFPVATEMQQERLPITPKASSPTTGRWEEQHFQRITKRKGEKQNLVGPSRGRPSPLPIRLASWMVYRTLCRRELRQVRSCRCQVFYIIHRAITYAMKGFIIKFTHGLYYWWAEVGTLSIIAINATLCFCIILYTLFLTLSGNVIASISSSSEHIGGVLF